ncbi:dual specificity protein phosphatase 12 [Plakobranchus ocellatus]|uniref:protein-tyrosine-phosphatase n=1 Tax=Plakobranchus ocellatus TaxID=259542 RepID=A0AAV4DNW3_9GAST|nr:dual specificity protein phosphatase 12 [Plakobranchus ocellatus]
MDPKQIDKALTKLKRKKNDLFSGVPESEIPSEVYIDPDYSAKGKAAFFKCRKCRLFLFHSGALTSHNIGEGESAFDWRSKIPANQKKREERESQERMQADGAVSTKCVRSLFVDPLAWMKGKIHEIQGKLHCPKCYGKIGSYVWYGEKCPCGAWVAPAFHIDSGKVDKIPSQPVTPSSHTPVPSQVGAAASSPPGGMIPAGRPLSYVPLPERSSSAASGRKGNSPVAAVQPRVATVASATVIRGGGTSAQGIFPSSTSSSSSAASTPASLSSTPSGLSTGMSREQRSGVQRVAATVAPLQTMDFDESGEGRMVENVDTSGDNHDIESGINSIHMDVDS